jgi:hypothetical protein
MMTSLATTSAFRGWVYRNMAEVARLFQRAVDSYDDQRQVIVPERWQELGARLREIESFPAPYTFIAAIVTPNYENAARTVAYNQSLANMTRIACALERHRLKHNNLPDTLDQLPPEFISSLPHDLAGGGPLKYQRKPDGGFTLYSIGWNKRDDGGVRCDEVRGKYETNDWVWPPQ